ncbi:glucoamylase family protein [Marinobacter sp. CHS3-4]|uniref:GH36-type glycosyl hydrolase domain-containing protein n=1 Tax=Marinobacter sp. CHS3-4 TaxID=3045174 RepID=UPI0024B57F9D|nr:glucoamylase family protein [Marinobacter sp. CHS3-4]MDI9245187.1 glucoamylase family protein [Marinobacter sp. CHS3-4]
MEAPKADTTDSGRSEKRLRSAELVAIGPGSKSGYLTIRDTLTQFSNSLDDIHEDLKKLRANPSAAGPWMDWYSDNEYLVRRVLKMLRRDLTADFVQQLPILTAGDAASQIRVQEVAGIAMDRCEQRFDDWILEALVLENKESAPFNTAELWALPLFVRYQVLVQIFNAINSRIEGLASAESLEGMVDIERRDVVADGVWSLHQLERTDWKGFFERTSQVEAFLREDPAGVYPRMDFETRDRYRRQIESLARLSRHNELDIAQLAIELSEQGRSSQAENVSSNTPAHVGYYLIGDGKELLEQRAGYQPGPVRLAARWFARRVTGIYFSGLAAFALLLILIPTVYATLLGPWWQGVLVVFLALVPGIAIASVLVNWLVTLALPPRVLPKLDFTRGIDPDHKAVVCMALLISKEEDVDQAIRQIERHYLANVDPALRFCLLTGLFDAEEEKTDRDASLTDRLRAGIERLNDRYSGAGEPPFFWMHRGRTWNPQDACWMEWERKRGKLREFNDFLLTGNEGTFIDGAGDRERLRDARYVITLDADTFLPVGAAKRLVGTIAHPLNQPVWDIQTGEIKAGYSILQPRVEINPLTSTLNIFTRIFSGDRGLDLYSLAVSDVYQDLFGEGIFTGKGLYHVAAFEASLANAIPEGAILSHDLFEGIHGRTALLSDVIMYEDYPPEYLSFVRRLHRWVRGDWQILPWLWPSVPTEDGGQRPNRLDLLHRWQIAHNLIRSLQSPWLILLLLMGWLSLPGSPLHWTALALLTLLVPTLTGVVGLAHASVKRRRSAEHIRNLRGDLKRWLLAVAFLPVESSVTVDAIVRSLYRNYFSHKHLLEWTPAAMEAGRSSGLSVRRYWRVMWVGPALAFIVGAALALTKPATLLFAAPVLVLWLVSPQLAYLARRERRPAVEKIRPEDRTHLRRIARRTWYFFERFVGPEDHWLPPDHFQEDPKGVVAHRTSPTNIGLLLTGNLTAYDMGYIDAQELVIRSRNTLRSMDKLPRFRGHILNWCDTHHLSVLPPAYVSTVDSGNLLGCLVALKQGMISLGAEKVWGFSHFEGLLDTVGVLEDTLGDSPPTGPRQGLAQELVQLRKIVMDARNNSAQWPSLIGLINQRLLDGLDPALKQVLREPQSTPADTLADMRLWLERAHHHSDRLGQSADRFLPWWKALPEVPDVQSSDLLEGKFDQWLTLREQLSGVPTFEELAAFHQHLSPLVEGLVGGEQGTTGHEALDRWLKPLAEQLEKASSAAKELLVSAHDLANSCERWFTETDMAFLFDPDKQVFCIGYNVDQGKLDDNAYDLLASEARLASFLAIAKGDVPARHWIHLGRPLTKEGRFSVLLSWSGTMFEYLMPQLLMREPTNTLLGQSALGAIANQIRYASDRGIPWGISECGYYLLDGAQNYAYHAFGAPELALRAEKGEEDCVVAPYATFLAMLCRPQAAFDNLKHLEALGMLGRYGFFEAIDFTQRRMEVGQDHSIVRSYMAHHHGMSLVGLGIALERRHAVSRFTSDPRVQACELFLQEKVASEVEIEFPTSFVQETSAQAAEDAPIIVPWSVNLDSPTPRAHLLSNGRLSVLASSWGSGQTTWNDSAITRWHQDSTTERWGNWIYLQDESNNDLWSISRSPVKSQGQNERVRFHGHCVEYRRQDGDLIQTLEVSVSPWHDVELRRLTLTNHGERTRTLRLTSYAEIVLADPKADAQHPAFSNLFVHSEWLKDRSLLLFERRSREVDGEAPVVGELLMDMTGVLKPDGVETDRAAFLGRGGSLSRPESLTKNRSMEGTPGYSLDPVSALQKTVVVKPGVSTQLAFLRIVGDSREDVLATAERFTFWPRVRRTFEEGRIQVSRDLWRAQISGEDLQAVAALTSAVLFPHPRLRAAVSTLSANQLRQENLWGVGISGDFPIVLLTIGRDSTLETARSLLKAHEFWRKRNFKVDLILLNVGDTGYQGTTQDTIRRLLASQNAEPWVGGRGGIFPLTADALGQEEVILLKTAASVVLDASSPSLTSALRALDLWTSTLPRLPVRPLNAFPPDCRVPMTRPDDLLFDNGHGGFTRDGREYVIDVTGEKPTPAPWSNVIANERFGCTVSESGAGFSWFLNSGENRLTPWHNDPVLDEPGECVYVRDEETGALWSPTPGPVRHDSNYIVRHGAGYSRFKHHRHGIETQLTVFVAPDDPIKLVRITIRNHSNRVRRLTFTYYAEWVMGTRREASQAFIKPAFLPEKRALIASNPFNPECPEQIAFLGTLETVHGYTTDRNEFLGRRGGISNPAALKRVGLANRVEPGVDPCAALQVHVDLAVDGEQTIVYLLGAETSYDRALELIGQYDSLNAVEECWQSVQDYWDRILGGLVLSCPDDSVSFMFNRWLLYQSLSCRMHGRTALYQSSGAFGFRDQLQDSTALLQTAPEVCRAQILKAAAHQFPEGDVLHWWHPPNARGVRTRISDDLVWLPYVLCDYLAATGDASVLDEQVSYLEGEPLRPDEAERYAPFGLSETVGSVYEHCLKVLERANRRGAHGVPLIGGGDWNDGMNRVGVEGKGESVWMAWFLCLTLNRFAPICEQKGDHRLADLIRSRSREIALAANQQAWDGEWFRRAYYDNGQPLGSAGQNACEIDSIAQSWAVLSGLAEGNRARQAMDSVWRKLVKPDPGIVLLFTPAFRGRGANQADPGYIAAYPPGVRENGGQYTHAACWAGLAFAKLGDAEKAAAVLNCLNPVRHGDTREAIEKYKVEPYVIAADIYGEEPHTGRGGWTWYTGSGGWLYRFILEGILGFERDGNQLSITPCVPPEWPGFKLSYRYGDAVYHIDVERRAPSDVPEGVMAAPCEFMLEDDGEEHVIRIAIIEN